MSLQLPRSHFDKRIYTHFIYSLQQIYRSVKHIVSVTIILISVGGVVVGFKRIKE